MNQLKAFLKLIRLNNLLIIALTQLMAKYFIIGPSSFHSLFNDSAIFLIVASTFFIAAAGYMINDYYDVKIDAVNKPEEIIVGKYISRVKVLAINLVFNAIAMFLVLLISYKLVVFHLAIIFVLWYYSNSLKRLPFWGNFTIALLSAATMLSLWIYYREAPSLLIFLYVGLSFFMSLVREIIKDIEDIRGDMMFGCRTLPVIYGYRKTKEILFSIIISFILYMAIFAWFLDNTYLQAYFVILMVFMGYFLVKLYYADTKKAFYKLSLYAKFILMSGGLSMIML